MISRPRVYLPMLLVVLVLAPNVHAAAPTKAEIETYLTNIKKSHNKLYAAGAKFGETLLAEFNGEAEGHTAINLQYRKTARAIGGVLRESAEWEVPEEELSQQLGELNDQFLRVQVDLILVTLADVVEIIEDDTLELEAKQTKIRDVLAKGTAKEEEVGALVQQAWKKLAAEYEIEVEE